MNSRAVTGRTASLAGWLGAVHATGEAAGVARATWIRLG
jgi:hypothetical protein